MSSPVVHYKAGDDVEGFRVISEVGQGAASVVYLVQDPKTKQIWSLKHVVKDEKAKDNRFLDQAIFEYEVASKLDHPNIRKIVKLVKKTKRLFQLSEVFLVMEYVDGVAMDRRPPRTLDDALVLFHQVAQAMAHMHERGFVHADMKPNNIMVVPGESGPIAKLIDLGQSCATGTIKPRIQGTPDYIAPEQVHRRAITPVTDVYNLGATMYYIFSGGHKVPTALSAGTESLVSKVDDDLIPRPTLILEHNPRLPVKLAELIMASVAIEAEVRPQTMQEVVDRLALVLGVVRARRNDGSAPGELPVGRPDPAGTNAGSSAGSGAFNLNSGSTAVGIRIGDEPSGPGAKSAGQAPGPSSGPSSQGPSHGPGPRP